MRLKLFISMLGGSFFLLILSPTANAVSLINSPQQKLTIKPSIIEQSVDSGSSTNGSFEITNQGTTPYVLSIYSSPYFVSGENYTPVFKPVSGILDISNWLSFNVNKIFEAPGRVTIINYTINVPKNIKPGDYFAAVFAQTNNINPIKNSNIVQINQRVGTLFYINVPGPVVRIGKIASWHSSFLQQSPVNSYIRLENDGGVHYFSNIQIEYKNFLNNVKYNFSSLKVVFPHTTRLVNASWPNAPIFGLYKVEGTATVFNATKRLPTTYILIISPIMRIVLILVIFILSYLLLPNFRKFIIKNVINGKSKNIHTKKKS